MRRVLGTLGGACLIVVLALLGQAPPAGAEDADTWIVVPAPAFRDAVKPLEAHRRARGYRVVRIDFEPGAGGSETLRASIRAAVRTAGGRADVREIAGNAHLDPEADPLDQFRQAAKARAHARAFRRAAFPLRGCH